MDKFLYFLTLGLCRTNNKNNYILSIEKKKIVKETNTIYEIKSCLNNFKISKTEIGIVEKRQLSYDCIECYVCIDNKDEIKNYKAKLEKQLLIEFNKTKSIIFELENAINNGMIIDKMLGDNDEYII